MTKFITVPPGPVRDWVEDLQRKQDWPLPPLGYMPASSRSRYSAKPGDIRRCRRCGQRVHGNPTSQTCPACLDRLRHEYHDEVVRPAAQQLGLTLDRMYEQTPHGRRWKAFREKLWQARQQLQRLQDADFVAYDIRRIHAKVRNAFTSRPEAKPDSQSERDAAELWDQWLDAYYDNDLYS